MREFRCAAEAAVAGIKLFQEPLARRRQGRRRKAFDAGRRAGFELIEGRNQRRRRVRGSRSADRENTLPPAVSRFAESRHAMARLVREVGAAEKRPLVVGVQKHGQRPAAGSSRDQLVRSLIDPINVGTLFTVDLHVDEMLVHHGRNFGIFKGFMRHHMAPVAG